MQEYFEGTDSAILPSMEALDALDKEMEEVCERDDVAAGAISELESLRESMEALYAQEDISSMAVSIVTGSLPGVEYLAMPSMESIEENPKEALSISMETVGETIGKILKAMKEAVKNVFKTLAEFLKNLFMGAKSMQKRLAKLKAGIKGNGVPKEKNIKIANGAAIEFKRSLEPSAIVDGAKALEEDSRLILEDYMPALSKAIDEHIGRLTDTNDTAFEKAHQDIMDKAERFAKNNTGAFMLPGGYMRNIQAITAHQTAGLQLPTPKYTRSPSKAHDDMEATAPTGAELIKIIDHLNAVFSRVENKRKIIGSINEKRREWIKIMDDWVARADSNVPVAGTNIGIRYRIARARTWFTLDQPVRSASSIYWKSGRSLMAYVEAGSKNLG